MHNKHSKRTAWLGKPDGQVVEWLLFLFVFVLSLREAWIIGGGNSYDFFWCAWDGLGYYQWLPAAFIDRNVDWMIWTHMIAEDRGISLFTLGVAVLQLPFFLVGHGLAQLLGYPSMGFDPPYAVAMMASTATYTGLGAVLAYRLAARYSDEASALFAILSLYAASNLFYYAAREPLMSHVYSFFLISLFCWTALKVIDGPRGIHVLLFVLSGALLVLVRQLNVFTYIFPLWMAWTSPGGIRGAWRNLVAKRGSLLLGIVLGVVPWIMQSLYWHHLTGHWYANGYSYKEEFFEFDKMVPGLVLFSPRNGWFVYSPIFLPIMAFLLWNAWRNSQPARPVLLIFLLVWLTYSAWWCWWLGGTFGYRGFVDLYGLLVIPCAWLFRRVLRAPLGWRIFTALVLVVLVQLNFGLMDHRDEGRYWEEEVTWSRIFSIVGEIAAGR